MSAQQQRSGSEAGGPAFARTRILAAIGFSLSILAPTLALSFSTALAARVAGQAAPLAFLAAGVIMSLVAVSFARFSQRIASAGSVFAFVGSVFGLRTGFVAGWTLLLGYLMAALGAVALVGIFAATALQHAGVQYRGLWLWLAATANLLVIVLAGRRLASLTRLLLVLEGLSVLAILILAAVILHRFPWSLTPFHVDGTRGVSGLGMAIVFAISSFGGFEGAATIAEETQQPEGVIPSAIMATIVTAIILYVGVTYAEIIGFGMDAPVMAKTDAPLDALAARFMPAGYGVVLDGAAAISAFGCAVGSISAAARLLYAFGRSGFASRLGRLDGEHGIPRDAVLAAGLLNFVLIAVAACFAQSVSIDAMITVGSLAFIVVYLLTSFAQAIDAGHSRQRGWCAISMAGAALLVWPLFADVYPRPPWPKSLWPFLVAGWIVSGVAIAVWRRR